MEGHGGARVVLRYPLAVLMNSTVPFSEAPFSAVSFSTVVTHRADHNLDALDDLDDLYPTVTVVICCPGSVWNRSNPRKHVP